METIAKRHYHIKGMPTKESATWQTVDNYIEADVYYTTGGFSYFSYKNTPRGYFMSVRKIGKYATDNGVIMEARLLGGDGRKKLIKEVARKSNKATEEAKKIFESEIDDLIAVVFPDLELELEEV